MLWVAAAMAVVGFAWVSVRRKRKAQSGTN
jgi:hypothetical protein